MSPTASLRELAATIGSGRIGKCFRWEGREYRLHHYDDVRAFPIIVEKGGMLGSAIFKPDRIESDGIPDVILKVTDLWLHNGLGLWWADFLHKALNDSNAQSDT